MENDIIIDELLDITEVCEIYNVSSRTLRFYEEAGLIESCRTANNNRRKYNKEQIAKIRDVLFKLNRLYFMHISAKMQFMAVSAFRNLQMI